MSLPLTSYALSAVDYSESDRCSNAWGHYADSEMLQQVECFLVLSGYFILMYFFTNINSIYKIHIIFTNNKHEQLILLSINNCIG
jgi:hypothetical protein